VEGRVEVAGVEVGFKAFKGDFSMACAAMTSDMQNKETMRLRLPGDRSSRWRLVRAMSGGGVTPALQRCEDTLQRRSCRSRWPI
jgi:hypothetical protein